MGFVKNTVVTPASVLLHKFKKVLYLFHTGRPYETERHQRGSGPGTYGEEEKEEEDEEEDEQEEGEGGGAEGNI